MQSIQSYDIQLHDMVALKEEVAAQRFMGEERVLLRQGQVGTVVERLGDGEAFEVEFADREGQIYAMQAIPAEQLMLLRYEPVELLAV